eukprot:CAMPEP_0197589596 /NCGR_PEP_ID=MMETSP1326-20131121/10489_1 /TAXON_ID=1155430 /ORGANISM="Genus nov. species nov., Strain RCC2288" /LENGTH=288 /DNA_ID=CAMNT_0043154549 /DNA_START=68 /DNA_END=934 /DNA_ORIENTATION=+
MAASTMALSGLFAGAAALKAAAAPRSTGRSTGRSTVKTAAFFGFGGPSKGAPQQRNKVNPGDTFADVQEAVECGLIQGCAPFEDGIDLFGFYNGIDQSQAQRYADVEITHGRVAMLAALGFVVGEQVEGSSFLFDAAITGPAIDHFQQVPVPFWAALGVAIIAVEVNRVNFAWQNPFEADSLFLQLPDFEPGDYNFDPLGLAEGKDDEWLLDMKMKELNNGRVGMIAISGMVAQELVNGLNLIPADEVGVMGNGEGIAAMVAKCTGAADEAACSKAFEAAERVVAFAQ